VRVYAINLNTLSQSRDCWDISVSQTQESGQEPDNSSLLADQSEVSVGTESRGEYSTVEPDIPSGPDNPDIDQVPKAPVQHDAPIDQPETRYEHLCQYLGRTVETPKGHGWLSQVFQNQASVALFDNSEKSEWFDLEDVMPDNAPCLFDGFNTGARQ